MRMRTIFAGLAVALVAWGLGAPPSGAQTPEMRRLVEEVARLNKDIRDVQRYVYRGKVPVPGAQAAPAGGDEAAARVEVRLSQIEDEMRGLTGTIEKVAHDIDVLASRVDKLVADVDFRLTAIERAQAEQAKLAAAPAGPATAPQASAPLAAPQQPRPPAEPGTLGTLVIGAAPAEPAAPPAATLAPALPPGTPKQQYDYAFSLLRQAEYAEAARALNAFIEAHPDDTLTGNAYYWLAETYYVRSDYTRAAEYFARGYKNFPDSIKAPDNLLKLGMSLANLDKKDEACLTFSELGERFPDASPSIKQRVATEGRRTGCS